MAKRKLSKEELVQIRKIVKERTPSSNMMVAQILMVVATVSLVIRVIFEISPLDSTKMSLDISLVYIPILMLLVSGYCVYKRGKVKWMKYALIIIISLLLLAADIMSGYKTKAMIIFPMVLAIRYYDRRFSHFAYVLCIFLLLVASLSNALFYSHTLFVDLNTVSFINSETLTFKGFMVDEIIKANLDKGELLENTFVLTFMPNLIFLSITHFTIMNIMKNNIYLILDLNDVAIKEKQKEAELIDARTKIVLTQVRPHFIYNTLTSIAYLCGKDPKKAKELTLQFSSYLRGNLDSIETDNLTLIKFSDELEHIKNYLYIEKARFEDRLNVEYDIEYDDFEIPNLLIQPIVENAVKHGVCKKEEGGTVKIKTTKNDIGYQIIVSDDGVGFDVHEVFNDGKNHVGMLNTKKRIELSGNSFELKTAKGEGTTVIITVPFVKDNDNLRD